LTDLGENINELAGERIMRNARSVESKNDKAGSDRSAACHYTVLLQGCKFIGPAGMPEVA
jgi:hypothetical protein